MKQHSEDTFYLALIEFLMTAKQHVIAIGDEFDLTSVQAITLLLIDEHNPRPMKSFCGLYHCDASNITGIVDGLENKGLVSRQNDPEDRRIKIICLEPAGKRMQHDIIRRLDGMNGPLFSALSASEKKQFANLVAKIAATKTPS